MINTHLRKAHLWSNPILTMKKQRKEREEYKAHLARMDRAAQFEYLLKIYYRLGFLKKAYRDCWEEVYQKLRSEILEFNHKFGEFNDQELRCLKDHLLRFPINVGPGVY